MRKILFLLSLACCCQQIFAQHQPAFAKARAGKPDQNSKSDISALTAAKRDASAFGKAAAGSSTAALPKPEIDIIRERVIDDLLSPTVSDDEIKRLTSTIKPDGSWPGIDYKDTTRTGFEHRIHLENMVTLSRAWRKNKNEDAKKTLAMALDFWLKHDFICQNWWWNEMGTPNLMINTLLLFDNDLTEEQRVKALKIARRANLEAWGARPSGDRIQIAGMLGKQALFARNADTLARVMNEMVKDIKISVGVGLNPDLSFHHRTDNVISTLSYGTGFASAFAYWAAKTVGTKYALPQQSLKLLIDYYLDGICSSLAFGKYPDPGARNRDISRRQSQNEVGADLPENLAKASNYRAKELQDIIKLRKGEKANVRTRDHFFWHSEYYTHQRPAYFASVRMHSSRGNNMEQPHNEEGLKNHHYGDGSTWITVTGKEYLNIFPAFDFQKIPGATIVQQPALPHWNQLAKKGLTDFVGGVTDGKYGTAATDFACVHDPLKARKSWFFFDKEFVCLGAGIHSKAEYPVVTTVNQCLLNGEVIIQSASGQQKPDKGKHALNDVSWIWHDNVAYIFPEPVDINCNNTTATGSWRSINHQSWATDERVQKDIFCLWFDHGPKPMQASYAYIVAPATDANAVAGYSKKTSIEILSNTHALQAVRNKALQLTQVVFYEAGEIKLSDQLSISVSHPCMVMISTSGKTVKKITVSDPARKLSSLELTIKQDNKASTKKIELPKEGYAGSSVIVSL